VVTTFLVNLVLLPFRILAARSAKRMKALKPQVDAINARYKSRPGGLQMDPEHSREISELYREHRISPMGGRGEAVPGRAGSPPQAYSSSSAVLVPKEISTVVEVAAAVEISRGKRQLRLSPAVIPMTPVSVSSCR
jgi:hypothetical protein